jgi:hypothetical protein
LLPRAAIVRSSVSGGILAAAAFAVYWWEAASAGELEARALALIVLLAGYQVLLFVERLALPGLTPRIPRTPVFWIVWVASALSLAAMLCVPSLAQLFRVAMPPVDQIAITAAIGAGSIAWRLIPSSQG